MNIINQIRYQYYKKAVLKFTEDFSFHMSSICIYWKSNNSTVRNGDLIKEAINLLDTWERISDNVYKNKQSKITIEIKKNDKLEDISKIILKIEISNIAKKLPSAMIKKLIILAENKLDLSSCDNLIN